MNNLSVLLFFLLLNVWICRSQENCIFDESVLTDNFLEKADFVEYYKWNNEKKEAAVILKNGNIVNIKKWACNHFGTSANMLIAKESYNPNALKSYFEELSKIACSSTENKFVKTALENYFTFDGTKGCREEIDLSNETYPEFYLLLYDLEDFTVVSIFYYKKS